MNEEPTRELDADREAEPCSECGYPLAADQRYCLNCGRRHGEPRVDFAPYVEAGRETEPAPAASAAAPVAATPREPSPLVAVAGIALLGLMLMVGVLLGRDDGDGGETAAPTVVEVGGGSTEVADAGASGGGEAAGGGGTEKVASDKAGGGGAAKEGGGGGGSSDSAAPGSTDNPEVADRDELEALENATGEEQQEASENLPDTIQLPGKPPPVDDEEPGGGTNATVIE